MAESDEERSRREAKDIAEAIQINQGNACWQGCGLMLAVILVVWFFCLVFGIS